VEHSYLESWGYHPFFSDAFSSLSLSLSRPDLAPARVVSDLGPRLEIVDARKAVRLAQLSGRLRHASLPHELPTVGDWVAIAEAGDADPPAIVHHVLPRRTRLVRRAAGRRDDEQVVAANVDTFFVVTSANRDANARRVERYLTAVWDSGAVPVLVVNKIDLCGAGELARTLDELATVAPGVAIVAASAHLGEGVAALAAYAAPGQTIALIGSSGVGKSSLVNRLLGRTHQEILPIDENDRGRHATTRRELFALPGGGRVPGGLVSDDLVPGGLLIDTPGMRSFGLLDTDGGLDETFADITALATSCRFRDCRHEGEPGCAVDAAIDAGDLDPTRRDGLHKLERELAAAERRRDPALAREERARWKAVNKAQRARSKVDPKLRR
jgi:ribosome biogenesis GTPase / thiamine phosphate phosphatase